MSNKIISLHQEQEHDLIYLGDCASEKSWVDDSGIPRSNIVIPNAVNNESNNRWNLWGANVVPDIFGLNKYGETAEQLTTVQFEAAYRTYESQPINFYLHRINHEYANMPNYSEWTLDCLTHQSYIPLSKRAESQWFKGSWADLNILALNMMVYVNNLSCVNLSQDKDLLCHTWQERIINY